MLRVVVGGQIAKNEIAKIIQEQFSAEATVEIMGDIQAASAVKNGQADICLGACDTGGGGALAMAIAILGYAGCVTVSSPGRSMEEKEIIEQVKAGKKAFGFIPEDAGRVVPIIIRTAAERYDHCR